MSNEKKRLGYIHKFNNMHSFRDWIFDVDLKSEDKTMYSIIKEWLCGLHKPAHEFAIKYAIRHNYEAGGWIAEYITTVEFGMECVVLGYGDTPELAIANVRETVDMVLAIEISEYDI